MGWAMKRYRNLSLFSGGLGFDIGLESSGRFDTIATIEANHACCETIRANHSAGRIGTPEMKIYEDDIRLIDPKKVMRELGLKQGELDLLTAGPPCQSFSTTGRRRTVEDPRGTLLWRTLDYIEVFTPKAFIIENVRGLLSAALKHRPISQRPDKGGKRLSPEEEPGSVIRSFLADVRERLGAKYRVDVFEVNAVNYGAAQLRERAVIIGNRLGAGRFPAAHAWAVCSALCHTRRCTSYRGQGIESGHYGFFASEEKVPCNDSPRRKLEMLTGALAA